MSAPHDDLYALARITVTSGTTADRLAAVLSGIGVEVCPYREQAVTRAWRRVRQARQRLAETLDGSHEARRSSV